MKLLTTFLVAAGLAAAQSEGDLPTCAQGCLNEFISGSQIADCSRLDIGCICANEDFINGIGCCLLGACDESDQQSAIEYAAKICGAEGVTVPTEITCTTDGSTGSSPTATATSSLSGDPEETEASSATDSDAASATEDSTGSSDATDTATGAAAPTAIAGMGGLAAGVLAVAALL